MALEKSGLTRYSHKCRDTFFPFQQKMDGIGKRIVLLLVSETLIGLTNANRRYMYVIYNRTHLKR